MRREQQRRPLVKPEAAAAAVAATVVSDGNRQQQRCPSSHRRKNGVVVAAKCYALRTRWKLLLQRPNGKVQFVTVALMAAIFILCLASAPILIDAQLAWSPIQVDSESKWSINIIPSSLQYYFCLAFHTTRLPSSSTSSFIHSIFKPTTKSCT